jgi:hypothetical protein
MPWRLDVMKRAGRCGDKEEAVEGVLCGNL